MSYVPKTNICSFSVWYRVLYLCVYKIKLAIVFSFAISLVNFYLLKISVSDSRVFESAMIVVLSVSLC